MQLHNYLAALARPECLRATDFLTLDPRHYDRTHPGYLLNGEPPEDVWPHLVEVVTAWDRIAARCGHTRVAIVSCYRTSAFSRACGGQPAGPHVRGNAADAVSDDPHRVVLAARCYFASGEGQTGRVALDRATGIVHLDLSRWGREISAASH